MKKSARNLRRDQLCLMEEASIIRNIKFNVSFFVIDENSNTRYQYVIDFQYERD